MDEGLTKTVGVFAIKSFHIFLILLVLVGWAILPKDEMIPLIITMVSIPILWVIMSGDCILSVAEDDLVCSKTDGEGDVVKDSFSKKIFSRFGIDMDNNNVTGISMLILAVSVFLAARRLL
jgi:hypothetical protein